MTDIEFANDNDGARMASGVLSNRDYRLNFALSSYEISPDHDGLLAFSGIQKLAAHKKYCVGDLVTMRDDVLARLVGPTEAEALRNWQESVVGISRGTKVPGWVSPSQPLKGF